MAATISKEVQEIESQSPAIKQHKATVEFANCECCGLTEEYTPAYVACVRERYEGRWICGLCAEAVKYEMFRSDRDISTDEALNRHMKFCEQFRSSSPPIRPTEDLITAMKQLLRRTLDSPRKGKSVLVRSKSCFSSISESKEELNYE